MFRIALLLLVFSILANAAEPTTRIAFGSCLKETRPQPIWNAIRQSKPDAFLMIGDNIYGDSDDMKVLRRKYETLFENEGFQSIWNNVPFYATWDDHDYGANDAGKEFRKKDESQALFYEFFRPDAPKAQRERPGVYDSVVLGEGERTIQLLILDTRYFRDELRKDPNDPKGKRYLPSKDKSKSLLGEAQWKWLESELRKPATIRILVTSIEFNGEEHPWEKWYNLPHERGRLYDLIKSTKAEGLFIISGDRHRAMLSKNTQNTPYPLYEITSSSLNLAFLSDLKPEEPNKHRIGASFFDENFGFIEVDWEEQRLVLEIRDNENNTVRTTTVPFSQLTLKKPLG